MTGPVPGRSGRRAPPAGRCPAGPARATLGRRTDRGIPRCSTSFRWLDSTRGRVPRRRRDPARPARASRGEDLGLRKRAATRRPRSTRLARRGSTLDALQAAGIDLDPPRSELTAPPSPRPIGARRAAGHRDRRRRGRRHGARGGAPSRRLAGRSRGLPRRGEPGALPLVRARRARLRRSECPARRGRAHRPRRARRRHRRPRRRAPDVQRPGDGPHQRRPRCRGPRAGDGRRDPDRGVPSARRVRRHRAGVAALHGATIAIEGDEQLAALLAEMAEAIGATAVRLAPGTKAAYHAAAVLAAGGFVALLDAIAELGRRRRPRRGRRRWRSTAGSSSRPSATPGRSGSGGR